MAQVLAAVPTAGLESVLVAIDLGAGGHSANGQVSVEHVQNVLARLKSPVMAPTVETTLQLKDAPRADTARYDQLRTSSSLHSETHHAM